MKIKRIIMVKGKSIDLLCLGSGLVIGFCICLIFNYYLNLPSLADNNTPVRENDSQYKYINPLLECNVGAGISEGLSAFQNNVQGEVDQLIASKQADTISLYFRDMDNGPSFAINSDQTYIPASLLKVPLMMAYYKESETTDPNILQEKITYTQVLDTDVEYFSAPKLVLGQTYTVEQLIDAMIINSDNNAYDLLLAHVDPTALENVFNYLGVDISTDQITLNVKQYATFFQILFNASYLDDTDSEHAMSLLDVITFTKGLQAGVPANIQVVNKYGERTEDDGTNEKDLHDCGIIYYPNHPYLLCVMTQGKDFDQLASVISDLSKFVYNQVNEEIKSRATL